uniref:membrane protein of ER body 2-like isoform X2 n=1 Tax=Erigeron canadensis TaxID=72917 RepID=UPI001CB92F71|nr:membrane protein of ER body 2-like isoform X2 [Erigeron canadensis]
MENTEVQQQSWELQQQQEDDEDEVGDNLITRKKNLGQTPLHNIITNAENGTEKEEEKVQDISQENVTTKVVENEDEKEKEKQEYSVYFDTNEGNGESQILENTDVTIDSKKNENGVHLLNSNQNGEHEKHDNYSEIKSSETVETSSPSHINNKTDASEIQVIKDGDDEITEFDVETILKTQDTHDLFCPNCNSCITKRVILRKRKRRIPVPDAKRNKPEANVALSDSSDNRAQNGVDISLNDVPSTISNEYDQQPEPDVFRCLSCFSIFMPTGNGFKLFRIFGNKSNEENNEVSQKEVPVKKKWFSNIFASDKVKNNVSDLNKSGAEQSLDAESNVVSSNLHEPNILASLSQEASSQTTNSTMNSENNQVNLDAASVGTDMDAPSSRQGYDTTEQQIPKESDSPTETDGTITMDKQLLTSYQTDSNGKSDYPGTFVVKPPFGNAESAENSVSPMQNDGLKLVVPPNVGSLVIDNSQMNQELDVTVQSKHPDLMPGVTQQRTFQNNLETRLEEPLKVDKDVLTDKQNKLFEDLKTIERIKGKDTIITIGSNQPETSFLQSSPDTLFASGTPALQHAGGQSRVTTETGGRSLDVIKSIVYGGLMESIASLSVVSSAVAANAATVNVLALGLANIFGGLFVISHDLWDLKNDRSRKREDRYQQLLGQKADFPLHMVISLLSYLIFGFLPPVVYGFSFFESNDKNLKLVMVAAASAVCIIILAAGKAYTQNPPKSYLKTISYYLMFGFMVAGASYVFGDLIMKLLEKIDIFHSGSAVNLSILGKTSKPAVAAY